MADVTNLAAASWRDFSYLGEPAAGGYVYFYNANTTTPIVVYQDAAATTPHANPVVLNAYGQAPSIFIPFGSYRMIVTTSAGNQIVDALSVPNSDPQAGSGGGGGGGVTGYATGDYRITGLTSDTGWVRANGNTIGSGSSGASERANADCQTLFQHLWDTYADAQCAVVTGRGATSAADWASNKKITLPNAQERGIGGVRGMGGSATSLIPAAVLADPTKVGSTGGEGSHVLTVGELAAHDHGGVTGSTVDSVNAHNTTLLTGASSLISYVDFLTTGSGHTHTISSAGSSTAHNNVGPVILLTVLIKL